MTLDWNAYRESLPPAPESDTPWRVSQPPGSSGAWTRAVLAIGIFLATVWLTSLAGR